MEVALFQNQDMLIPRLLREFLYPQIDKLSCLPSSLETEPAFLTPTYVALDALSCDTIFSVGTIGPYTGCYLDAWCWTIGGIDKPITVSSWCERSPSAADICTPFRRWQYLLENCVTCCPDILQPSGGTKTGVSLLLERIWQCRHF